MDQHVTTQLKVHAYPTIELGDSCGGLHPASRMIYGSVGTPRTRSTIRRAFSRLFTMVRLSGQRLRALAGLLT